MKLTTVIASVNENPHYYNFIPYQIAVWAKFNLKFIVIYVGESIPYELRQFSGNIILWDKNLDISTVYTSQMLRALYPALLDLPDDEMVMITDMDMLPGRPEYYTADLDTYQKKDFIYYKKLGNKQVYMCYNAAHPDTWGEVFGIKSEQDIEDVLLESYPDNYTGKHGGAGWYTDQLFMYDKLIGYHSFQVLNRSLRRLEMGVCSQFITQGLVGFAQQYDDIPFHMSFFKHLWKLEYVCNKELGLSIVRGFVNKKTNKTWWKGALEETVNKLLLDYPHINKFSPELLPKSYINVDVAMQTLVEITDVFDAHQQNYRLVFGTLLGLYRDGRLIEHDCDIDIALECNDVSNLYAALQTLFEMGYTVLRIEDQLISLGCRHKSCYIDLYFYRYMHPGRLGIANYALSPEDFTTETTLHCNGKELKTVADPEYFCKKYYGICWKTPMKNFSATPHNI